MIAKSLYHFLAHHDLNTFYIIYSNEPKEMVLATIMNEKRATIQYII